LSVSQDAIARDKPQDKSKGQAIGTDTGTSEPAGQELGLAARGSLDSAKMQVEDQLVNLSPRMATVEIKTGSRKILSYLLSPLGVLLGGRIHHIAGSPPRRMRSRAARHASG
jgi:hemolysin D